MSRYHIDKKILKDKDVQRRVNKVPQIKRVRRIHRIMRIILVLSTLLAFYMLPWLGLIYVGFSLLISAALKRKYLEAIDEYLYQRLKEKRQSTKSGNSAEHEEDSPDDDEHEENSEPHANTSAAGRAVASYAVGKVAQKAVENSGTYKKLSRNPYTEKHMEAQRKSWDNKIVGSYSSQSQKCATCEYWQGNRIIDKTRKKVEIRSADSVAYCKKRCRSGITQGSHCPGWTKARELD